MKKVILITLAVVGVLAITCVGGIAIVGIWIGTKVGEPEGITVRIDQPATIDEGQTFDVVVEVTNALARERTLKDIDFYDPLLDGARLVRVDPVHSSYDTTMGTETFTMDQPIPANGSITVTLTFAAETAGTYAGDLDVSVDSVFSFKSTPHRIVIQPKK